MRLSEKEKEEEEEGLWKQEEEPQVELSALMHLHGWMN